MERGLSQDQLAALLGISRSAVGMYETGKREPDLETCEAIADIFNIDMDYLTGRSNTEKMHLTITDTDPQLDELTRNAKQLNAQGLQKLVDLSDDLVASGKYEKKPLNAGSR
ncbi:MAG: helix-turn-helix transcriptional regulator [Clostridiales bacterium]|nr:helix-turn-helix transcriptional regulator [Clostridiales bacterium]